MPGFFAEENPPPGPGFAGKGIRQPPDMTKQIKLSGREMGILRAIGFGLGISGTELQERTQLASDDLTDVLNTLLDIGYLETGSLTERVDVDGMPTENFEINPSYANDLKVAMKR